VIGAGLAGLVAGARLAEGGADVTVIATGAGGLHLSPGTIDVLGYAPERVEEPRAAAATLGRADPGHPYALLAGELEEALAWFRARVASLRYVGDGAANMLLPSAVGVARPTALAPASMATGDLRATRRFLVVGLRSLKDFFPRLLAANLARADLPDGERVRARDAEAIWTPRRGDLDVQSQVFGRALDAPGARAQLGDELRSLVEPGETILMPALLGLRGAVAAWEAVSERAGAPVAEVPTLPPSVPGMRLQLALTDALARARGRLVIGPTVVGCAGAGGRITAVRVRDSARERDVAADAVVLATGGFAAGGIALDSRGGLSERALGLPVAGPPEGVPPLSGRYLDHQPLMAAGVAVDDDGRPVDDGGAPVWENLYAAGAIVAGALPWREKSGEGIAIAGGHRAARRILEEA
jgi:glycerol-3-phosphate dehydrogenase subunit B